MKQYFEKYCQESLEEEKETQKLLEEIKIISNKADEYWKVNIQYIF